METFIYDPAKNLPKELHYPILIADIVRINGLFNNVQGIRLEYNWGYTIFMDWDVVDRTLYFSMPDGSKFSAEVEFSYSDKINYEDQSGRRPRRTSFFVCPVCRSRRWALYYNPFKKILCCKKDLPSTRLLHASDVTQYYYRAKFYCEKAGGVWSATCTCKFPEKEEDYASIDRWTKKKRKVTTAEEIVKLKMKFFAAQRKYFEQMIKTYQKKSRALRNKKLRAAKK